MRQLTSEDIRSLTPYAPGKPVEELERELGITGSIKLASNENPLGPSPKALDAVRGCLANLNRYPDGAGYYLKDALSRKLGHPQEGILLGNGSNEILEIIVRTFMLPGEEAIYAEPSFVVYKMAAQAADRTVVAVPLKDGRHDLMAMADRINDRTKLILIATPNNPTGNSINPEHVRKLLATGAFVVIDEAYHEYVADPAYATAIPLAMTNPRVVVTRTFSKVFGMAGLRAGYAVGQPATLKKMSAWLLGSNVNQLALVAAMTTVGDKAHVAEEVRRNAQVRAFTRHFFESAGYTVHAADANFMMVDVRRDAKAFKMECVKHKVAIGRPFPALPTYARVSFGTMPEMKKATVAFHTVLASQVSSSSH